MQGPGLGRDALDSLPLIEKLKPLLDSTDMQSLFPALLWQFQLKEEVYGAINAALQGVLDELRRPLPPLAPGKGWQSGHGLHRRAELRDLVTVVELAARAVLSFLKLGADEIEITGCWANVLAPGAVHPIHQHPNNFVSGVYYARAPRGGDQLNFHDPRPQAAVLRPPVTALTRENTDQVVVTVRPGLLLLFPAWLPHSVPENAGREERISVSFNLMFSRFAETLSPPLWGED
jgi:uncharacterized protein (TIGR02466 family)